MSKLISPVCTCAPEKHASVCHFHIELEIVIFILYFNVKDNDVLILYMLGQPCLNYILSAIVSFAL